MRRDWGQRGRLTCLEPQDSSVQGLCSDHPSVTSHPAPLSSLDSPPMSGPLPSFVFLGFICWHWANLPPHPLLPHTPTPPPSNTRSHLPSLQFPHTCDGVSRAVRLVVKLCVIKNLQLSPQPVIFIRVGILTTLGFIRDCPTKRASSANVFCTCCRGRWGWGWDSAEQRAVIFRRDWAYFSKSAWEECLLANLHTRPANCHLQLHFWISQTVHTGSKMALWTSFLNTVSLPPPSPVLPVINGHTAFINLITILDCLGLHVSSQGNGRSLKARTTSGCSPLLSHIFEWMDE